MATTLNQRLQYMESQAAHIEPRMRMVKRERIRYAELFPIVREASPYADVIIYYSGDSTGEMGDLANRANDYPLVQVQSQQHTQRIAWKGLAYDYSDREIERAMQVGQSLPDRKIRAAFRIAEETKQQVCYFGDSSVGWHGALNHSSIPTSRAAKRWSTASDDEIFNDINNLIGGAYSAVNEARLCNTLLLPTAQRIMLAKPMGDDASKSIEEYIRMYNPYTQETGQPLMIRTVPELATAGLDSSNMATTRAVAYVRDPEVVRFHVLQELMFMEPQRRADVWTYYGQMSLGGLEWLEPNVNRYFDHI